MICEACKTEFDRDWRAPSSQSKKYPLRFCSTECAHSRVHSKEQRRKISEGVKKSHLENPMSKEHMDAFLKAGLQASKNWREENEKQLLLTDFSTLTFERLRKRVLLEQEGKCNHCGLFEWRGRPLTLEIEHKDGNHHNNARENVEAICPNCHSLTPTWRGKNKKGQRPPGITDEELVESFLKTGNIRQCLLNVNLAAKGANYGRVKKALTLRGISYKL